MPSVPAPPEATLPMLVYLARRLVSSVVALSLVFLAVFVALRSVPGGPAQALLGQQASKEAVERINQQFGWDQPLPVQLGRYIARAAHGDLGVAYTVPSQPPVTEELLRRLPATVELTAAALLLATVVGVALGIVAACYRNRWPDHLAVGLSSIGVSIPVFFLGILLLLAFPKMPGGGRLPTRDAQGRLVRFEGIDRTGLHLVDAALAGRWGLFAAALRHLALPALTLASVPAVLIARVTRSSLLEVLGADYLRTARAKGAGPLRVLFGHALPAAAVPILGLLGLQLAQLLAGAVLTETVFSWPGLGRYLKDAALQRDFDALQGGVLLVGVLLVAVNTVIDVLCAWLDPRIRLRGTPGE